MDGSSETSSPRPATRQIGKRSLLDTHIFLWSILQPDRLTAAVRAALTAHDSTLWLSPISLWEVAVLAEKGRIELDSPPGAWLRTALKHCLLHEGPVTHEIALASRAVDLPHNDPADRFLAATATIRHLALVTADQRLIDAPNLTVLPNR
jgi:PIN domain nuclease of toxin-antitoxin system